MKMEMRMAAEMRADEIRAEGDEKPCVRFYGYAAKFDRWSDDLGGFIERIAPGAFDGAQDMDVRCLVNHNPDRVLGRTKSGTLKLAEDDTGLFFEVEAPDVGWTRDLYLSVARGDIDQCSFMFEPIDDEWEFGETDGQGGRLPDRRTLKKVKMYDVSIVTFPAYQDTKAYARASREAHELARAAHRQDERRGGMSMAMARRRLALAEMMAEFGGKR